MLVFILHYCIIMYVHKFCTQQSFKETLNMNA